MADDLDPGERELFQQLNQIEEQIGRPLPEVVRLEVARQYDAHRRRVQRLRHSCKINLAAAIFGIVCLVYDCVLLNWLWMRVTFCVAQAAVILLNGALWSLHQGELRNLPDGVVLQGIEDQ